MMTTLTPSGIVCPHCGARPFGSVLCEHCGKVLPAATLRGSVEAAADAKAAGPSSVAGATSGGEDGRPIEVKIAAGAMLAVGVLQIVMGGVLYFLTRDTVVAQDGTHIDSAMLLVSMVTIGIFFLGLYFWARRNPLPAAVGGLVTYLLLAATEYLMHLPAPASSAGQAMSIPWLKLVVLAMLILAVLSGLRHRKKLGRRAPR